MRMLSRFITVCLLVAVASGCDSAFEPFAREPNPPFFVITGAITNNDSTQVLRAELVRPTPKGAAVLNEFQVTSIVEGGVQSVWRDSIIVFADGSSAHVFSTDDNFESGFTVTITASRSNPPQSETISTKLPDRPTLNLGPVLTVGGIFNQDVTLAGVESQPRNVKVTYNVVPPETGVAVPVVVDYQAPPTEEPGENVVSVLLSRDYGIVLNQLNRVGPDNRIRLLSIDLDFDLVSPNWGKPPETGKAISFLESAVHESFSWILTPSQLVALGYSGN